MSEYVRKRERGRKRESFKSEKMKQEQLLRNIGIENVLLKVIYA